MPMNVDPTRSASAITRRTAIAGLGAGGLGLGLAATARQVAAQDATPGATTGHPLVGTWIVQFEDPAEPPAVAVWGADGSFVDAGNGLVGVWEATGPRTALHSWLLFIPDGSGYVLVSGTITVDETGDAWTQPYSSMVVAPDGTVVTTERGTVRARRLRPVPEDAIGTALEAVPTWTPATPEAATPTS